jgi:hypothetical protein
MLNNLNERRVFKGILLRQQHWHVFVAGESPDGLPTIDNQNLLWL